MATQYPMKNNYHVFISYAHIDGGQFARYLHRTLTLAGIPVWLDHRGIGVGQQFIRDISHALENAFAILIILTPGATVSTMVEAEWTYGITHHLPVIPMHVLQCKIPYVLQVFDTIDCRNSKKGVASLKKRLRTLKDDHLVYLRKKLVELEAVDKLDPGRFQGHINGVTIAIERWQNFFKSPQDQKEEQHTRISQGLEEARRIEIENAFRRSNQRARRVVGQRLSDVANFRDRLYEQQRIGALLARPSTRIVSVVSRGGMGKTAIASKILADLEMNRWPQIELDEMQTPVEGIIYLSVRTSGISLERIFMSFAELVSGEKGEAIRALWTNIQLDASTKVTRLLEILENKLYILLLDNMEDLLRDDGTIIDNDLQIFFDLTLLTSRGTRLLVTSRIPLLFRKEILQHNQAVSLLEGLPDNEAIELLRSLDPTGECGLRDAAYEKLLEAVQLVKGVPRAIEVLSSILANDHFTTLDELLSDQSIFKHDRFVEELVKENYKRLDTNARTVMEALAVYGSPVPVVAIDYLLEPFAQGLPVPTILNRLTQTHVVSVDRVSKMVALHPIDRDYTYTQLSESGNHNLRALHMRAASYYNQLRLPREQWVSLPDVEPQLKEFEHLLLASEYEKAAELLNMLDLQLPPASSYLFQWGHVKRAREMRERLVANLSTPELQWINWHQLGLAYTRLGLVNEAVQAHEAAVALTRELKDPQKEGISLVYLGLVYSHKEEYAKAIEYYLQALPINHRRPMEGNNLGHLGNAYAELGNIDSAVDSLKRAATLCNEQADRRSEAFWVGRLGDTYHRAGMIEEAIAYLQRALTLAEIINDKQIKVYHLSSLGDIYTDLNRIPEAINAYREAILFANDIGDRLNEVQASWSLGLLYIDTDINQAVLLMSARVAYERELGWPDAEEHAQQVQAIQNKSLLQNEK